MTAVRTMPIPLDLWRASSLAQQLALRLVHQHAESGDGTVCISPRVMQRYKWWDPARLDRARKELVQLGLLAKVQPYRPGTKARYRLTWLEAAHAP
ncbi:hypothetical protein [Tahibacter harae]|uniref:Helix-turn-helix protein n=1 Tax=Tahibacter harae TaxID=2963937 RepID=A0ABT1QQX4_9GAMM|nr:hypothetical protein [Tahibacter harae]MCQ4164699.1 hypothetical protein [Tahibacter harae]